MIAFQVTAPSIALGITTGAMYGLLAVGLVLIYRSTRIINFAHGEIGAFGAATLILLVVRWGVPYWAALPVAIVAGGATALVVETTVIRRLQRAPRVMSVIGTLGAGQLIFAAAFLMSGKELTSSNLFPGPPGIPSFNVGAFRMSSAHTAMLLFSPIVVAGLTAFLRRSRVGLALRASAANPEAARMATVPVARMSALAWAIGGGLAALTAVLIFPTFGLVTANLLGPGLLLRALAPAAIARWSNIPAALAGGIVLGAVEQIVVLNTTTLGAVDAVLLVVIMITLLMQRNADARAQDRGSWGAVQAFEPLGAEFQKLRRARFAGPVAVGIGLVCLAVLPLFTTGHALTVLVAVLALGIVGLSTGVVTGLSGQLSLGQFALAGVGFVAAHAATEHTGELAIGLAVGATAAAATSLLISVPALRIRGLLLAVTTLAFALVSQVWLFGQGWMLGGGVTVRQRQFLGITVDDAARYYLLTVGVLAIVLLLCWNVRRGAIGRSLVAVRDNELAARAFTVHATLRKVEAFAFAGAIAGVGGVLYGNSQFAVNSNTFSVGTSISVVIMALIGGVNTLVGPLVGAAYVVALPAFVPLDQAGVAATAAGALLIILYFPSGIVSLFRPVRDVFLRRMVHGVSSSIEAPASAATAPAAPRRRDRPGPLLEVRGAVKRFGGILAVDHVDLSVRPGELVGLVGPNGAGKTTLFELIGGFVRADAGRVVYARRDITFLTVEERGRLGLIRSFQEAALFETLTVLDVLRLAQERSIPTNSALSLVGVDPLERRRTDQARALAALFGLEPFLDKQVDHLSTGTRRITELACMMALEPRLLLLDEPSSGIAQRETEALGEVLLRVKRELNATIVLIEHDIPLVRELSDRVVAMVSGKIVVEGDPAAVLGHPTVVEAYLGTDARAIARSGTLDAHLEAVK